MLERMIKELRIEGNYRPFVDGFIKAFNQAFPQLVHGIYLCGSIPRGLAKPFKSDADFTVVFNNRVSEGMKLDLNRIKSDLCSQFPFVTKIDIHCCSLEEISRSSLGWNFWITIVSICVYGKDLADSLPGLQANIALIREINSDTLEVTRNLLNKLERSTAKEETDHLIKKISRRCLMALFSLDLEIHQFWTDDLDMMLQKLCLTHPEKNDWIKYLHTQAAQPDASREEFLSEFAEIKKWFEKKIEICLTKPGNQTS
ncbi:MAG: nucleotidyltransferase domain-containing protein [Candidatus Rifleibacteriota bacterium]